MTLFLIIMAIFCAWSTSRWTLKRHAYSLSMSQIMRSVRNSIFLDIQKRTLSIFPYYSCHNSEVLVTVKLTMDNRKKDKTNNYFEIHYSPLPSPFNLKVLASAVYPAQIFGITYGHMEPPSIPGYLRGYCRIPSRARFPNKRWARS